MPIRKFNLAINDYLLHYFPQKLEYLDRVVNVQNICSKVGISDIDVHRAIELLTKMSLTCTPVGREAQIKV
jgi:hypothetical protein